MREKKTQVVLEAATRIFLKYGYSEATTDKIQKAAKVSKPTLFTQYPNKEALFIAVIKTECEALTKEIEGISFDKSPTLPSMLTSLGEQYLNILLSPIALSLYRVVIAESNKLNDIGHNFFQLGPDIILTKTIEILNTFEVDSSCNQKTLESSAKQFLSLIRGDFQLKALTTPTNSASQNEISEWVDLCVKLFLNGYSK